MSRLSGLARSLLAQSAAKRHQATGAILALTRKLRGFYYPEQAAFFTSKHRRRATRKTRRAGATTGGVRELLCRAVEQPGFRATYVTTTRPEARDRAWKNDTQNGLVDVIEEFGERVDSKGVERFELGGVWVDIRDGDLALEFQNGSRIDLFGADDLRSIGKKRGGAKHVFWVDECQDFRFLVEFYKRVAVAALFDFKGECWLSGTPSQDCSGMFYEITKEPDNEDTEEMLKLRAGWEVHAIAQVNNPFFGATPEERWENTAGEAMRENGWTIDDPDLQREQLGKWVRTDGNYVYAVHQVPEHELCFAPARYDVDGFPDLEAAMADLPGYSLELHVYFTQMGADLGTRAAFAFVLWAWCLADPTLYEVCSWKKSGLNYDQMAERLRWVRERVVVGAITADAGGGGKPAVMGWSDDWHKRYNVPIDEAEKDNKQIAQKMLNNDIKTGKVKLRSKGVLIAEMRSHRWEKLRSATGKLVEGATAHDACDAGLYGHRMSYHHRGKVPEDVPPPGSVERLQQEERAIEQALEEQQTGETWWAS